MKKFLIASALLAGLSSPMWAATGVANIQGTSTGTAMISGKVMFEDTKDGLKISINIKNAPTGQHGFHIHEFGSCDDTGKAAGSHYNPMGHPHGNVLTDASKAHAGDLGNITINMDGTGKLEAVIPGVVLSGEKNSVGGRAVILHEKADDFGQPTGNAGGRIGCGTILITGN